MGRSENTTCSASGRATAQPVSAFPAMTTAETGRNRGQCGHGRSHATGGRFLLQRFRWNVQCSGRPPGARTAHASPPAVSCTTAQARPSAAPHLHVGARAVSRPGGHLPLPCGEGDSCPGLQLQATACHVTQSSPRVRILIDGPAGQSFTLTRAYAILLGFTALSSIVASTCL